MQQQLKPAANSPGVRATGAREIIRQYMKLTKVGLNTMVVLTTFAGYILASGGLEAGPRLLWTLLGTALAALGSSGVNQWLERGRDSRMQRTRSRPLPSGKLAPQQALTVSLLLAFLGDVVLGVLINPLTALLAVLVQLIYLTLYTPLKTVTPVATLLGAVCGALPPMMGYSAVTGRLDAGAWIMGALLFAWQIPHSLALAWMYRQDYRDGGYRLLPVLDTTGRQTFRMVLVYALALTPLALALVLAGQTGWLYAAGALLLGLLLVAFAVQLLRERTELAARRLFFASVTYLPLLLLLMMVDVGPGFSVADAAVTAYPQPAGLEVAGT